jgi:hypothetical protein
MGETEQEHESRIYWEYREMVARRGGRARARALTPERRREIASQAAKAAAARMSPEERVAKARRAARLRWARDLYEHMERL